MSQKQGSYFSPVLTSAAGSCLTLANWQAIGIEVVSYYLNALLIKPGLPFLHTLKNLRSYCGWSGSIVLNATLTPKNRNSLYTIRSDYDGNLVSIGSAEFFSLITSLQPDKVILPPGLINHPGLPWHALSKTVQVFIPANETLSAQSDARTGVYFHYDKGTPFLNFVDQIKHCVEKPIYVAGELTLPQAVALAEQGVEWLESDKPATDALRGQIYDERGDFNLLESEVAHQQELLGTNCTCPTCIEGFTRAYLHHLFLHTPLLCQRFLILHNNHYYQDRIRGSQ